MTGYGNFWDKEVLQPCESTVLTNKIFSATALYHGKRLLLAAQNSHSSFTPVYSNNAEVGGSKLNLHLMLTPFWPYSRYTVHLRVFNVCLKIILSLESLISIDCIVESKMTLTVDFQPAQNHVGSPVPVGHLWCRWYNRTCCNMLSFSTH